MSHFRPQHTANKVRGSDMTKAAGAAGLNRGSMPQAIKALQDAGRIQSKLPKAAKRNPVLALT